jgi:hypothetical protein
LTIPLRGPEVSGEWPVFPNYEVEDGLDFGIADRLLRGKGTATLTYRPQDREDLPFAIAKLATAPEPEIIRFASQWGALGWDYLWWRDNPFDRPAVYPGDPLEWLRLHSRYISLCIALTEGLFHKDGEAIVEAIQNHLEPEPRSGTPRTWGLSTDISFTHGLWPAISGGGAIEKLRSIWAPPKGSFESLASAETLETQPLSVGRSVRQRIINRHIEGVAPELSIDDKDTTVLRFRFTAMVEVAYLHLARLAVESSEIDRCEECGAYFKRQHGNQRFCPPSPYDSESRCSYRARYKRLRQKKQSIGEKE